MATDRTCRGCDDNVPNAKDLFDCPLVLEKYQRGLTDERPTTHKENNNHSHFETSRMKYIGDGELCELMQGRSATLFCPDGYNQTAIPYLAEYFSAKAIHNLDHIPHHNPVILFSWRSIGQSLDWTWQARRVPIVIGGSVVKKLRDLYSLIPPLGYQDIYWYEGDLNLAAAFVKPRYNIIIEHDPFTPTLPVYSGSGCRWGNCRFCFEHILPQNLTYPPLDYVAYCVEIANSLGKTAFLSAPYHTIDELSEMEELLKNNRGPYSYCAFMKVQGDVANYWYGRLRYLCDAYLGIEYLSDSVLQRIGKGITVEQVMSTIIVLLDAGVNVYGNIITDLWNTEEERIEHEANLNELLRMVYLTSRRRGRLLLSQNILT